MPRKGLSVPILYLKKSQVFISCLCIGIKTSPWVTSTGNCPQPHPKPVTASAPSPVTFIFSPSFPPSTKRLSFLALVILSICLKENFIQHFLTFMAEVLQFNWSFTLTILEMVSDFIWKESIGYLISMVPCSSDVMWIFHAWNWHFSFWHYWPFHCLKELPTLGYG